MGFLPKDYVGVSTRIEQAHEKHGKELSIETEFDIKEKTVIFTAKVKIKGTEQIFTGHSFGEAGKEKAFEKLETVAVGRALAFAGFETREGIASREEIEVFEEKKKDVWFNDKDFIEWTKSGCDYSIEAFTQYMYDNGFTRASDAMKEKVKNHISNN